MRMFTVTVILAILLFLGGVAAAGEQPAADVSTHPWIGDEAPGFKLETVGGGTLALADLRGKYVVIHFGASW